MVFREISIAIVFLFAILVKYFANNFI